jgi:NADH:ubiquinone oxidoreductase subunit 6 (subunit J)
MIAFYRAAITVAWLFVAAFWWRMKEQREDPIMAHRVCTFASFAFIAAFLVYTMLPVDQHTIVADASHSAEEAN